MSTECQKYVTLTCTSCDTDEQSIQNFPSSYLHHFYSSSLLPKVSTFYGEVFLTRVPYLKLAPLQQFPSLETFFCSIPLPSLPPYHSSTIPLLPSWGISYSCFKMFLSWGTTYLFYLQNTNIYLPIILLSHVSLHFHFCFSWDLSFLPSTKITWPRPSTL